MQTTLQARRIVSELFGVYLSAPDEMQEGFTARFQSIGSLQNTSATAASAARARVVADYIAGMTDRFAGREHARLTGVQLL